MRKLHLGYGFMSNVHLHDDLFNMDANERTQFELELKSEDERLYNGFKEWQKSYMKWFPEKKIDY